MNLAILAFAAAAVAAPADGELFIRKPGLEMRLSSEPCTDPNVLKHIAEKWHSSFRRLPIILDGTPESGCWIDEGPTIWFYMDDGSNGQMPKSEFERRQVL